MFHVIVKYLTMVPIQGTTVEKFVKKLPVFYSLGSSFVHSKNTNEKCSYFIPWVQCSMFFFEYKH